MSRTPDERLYSSGSNNSFAFTQCYVSFGDTDGEDFRVHQVQPRRDVSRLSGLPDGDWRVTVFDQWNDMLVDGLFDAGQAVRRQHTEPRRDRDQTSGSRTSTRGRSSIRTATASPTRIANGNDLEPGLNAGGD